MKKFVGIFSVMVLGACLSVSAHAEDFQAQGEPQGDYPDAQMDGQRPSRDNRMDDSRGGRMMNRQGMGPKQGMPGMMGMHKESVVATSDGGVVILSGRTLSKYDAKLNLINQVELKNPKPGNSASRDARPREEMPPSGANDTRPSYDEATAPEPDGLPPAVPAGEAAPEAAEIPQS